MKERIICLVTPDSRSYYRAVPLAKEFLDKDHNLINTAGTLPEGEVEEFDVTTKTIKHYKAGKLDGELEIIDLTTGETTFFEKYKDGILMDVADHTLHGTPLAPDTPKPLPTYTGTVIKVNKKTQSFYIDGKEVAEQTVSGNGSTLELLGDIPDGPAKEFDENGLLRADAEYKNNKLEGMLVRYDEKGRPSSKEHYVKGQLQGPAEYYTYTAEGTIKTSACYKNGQLDSDWVYYFPNSIPCIKAFYKNGKLQGRRTAFYQNGKTCCEESYENGKLHGKRIIYFPEGPVWYEENYKNGRLDGERCSFFPNGQKRCAEYYADGLLEGPRAIYAEDGNLLQNEEYHYGTLLHNTERRTLS